MTIAGQTYYSDRKFDQIQLAGGEIQGSEFINCIFVSADFSGAVYRSCRFIGCVFHSCDLSLIRLQDCGISGSEFYSSKLVGVDWTLANWEREAFGEPLKFTESILNHSTFIGLAVRMAKFTDCILHNVDFREADLSQADFSGADLADSIFLHTNLTEANLETARNYHIAPEQNTLSKARFSFPEALSLLYAMDISLEDPTQTDEGI